MMWRVVACYGVLCPPRCPRITLPFVLTAPPVNVRLGYGTPRYPKGDPPSGEGQQSRRAPLRVVLASDSGARSLAGR